MQTLAQIKALLESKGVRPKRSLGQNFLIDHNLIRKLVDAAGLRPGEVVLEVGPGTGTMTEELLARGCEVIACELDDTLAELLTERLTPNPHFTLIHADCLAGKQAVNPSIVQTIADRPFKLVANLPYGAGTPLLSLLLIEYPACSTFAVTIQREVADRLLAAPGGKDFGPLAVIAQALCEVTRVATAPPECFWPRPDVTSAMVLMTRRAHPLTSDPRTLSAACRLLFAQRRKQLGSLLAGHIDWPDLAADPITSGIVPTYRAEQLSVEQIVALSRTLRLPSC